MTRTGPLMSAAQQKVLNKTLRAEGVFLALGNPRALPKGARATRAATTTGRCVSARGLAKIDTRASLAPQCRSYAPSTPSCRSRSWTNGASLRTSMGWMMASRSTAAT